MTPEELKATLIAQREAYRVMDIRKYEWIRSMTPEERRQSFAWALAAQAASGQVIDRSVEPARSRWVKLKAAYVKADP